MAENFSSKTLMGAIRDIIIFLIVAGICYIGNMAIDNTRQNEVLKGEISNIKTEFIAKVDSINSKYDSEHSETYRRFGELDKKFDQLNSDLNKRLDRLDNKLDSFFNRISPLVSSKP